MTLRLLITFLALLAVAAVGLRGTHAAFTASETTSIEISTGSVGIERSGDGLVFSSAPLAPGDAATATVKVTNSGTLASDLVLARANQSSTAPNGCAVADALRLKVVEGGRTLVDGPLKSAASDLALGTFAPSAARTYEITLTFAPQHGATASDNDNCFEGSVDTERFTWRTTEARA